MFANVLVVCIGNICRSPMGEALLSHALQQRGKECLVHSAGLAALVGRPADPTSEELMRERGIDISGHRARQLKEALVTAADLILVMDRHQQREISSIYPSAHGKVHSLGKWGQFEIPDPYRGSRAEFVASLDLIERGVNDWLGKAWK